MSDRAQHTDVGAYALGLLDDTDRELFELHLTGCESCAAEFADLSGMRELFSGVGPVEVDPLDADPLDAGPHDAGPLVSRPLRAGPPDVGPAGRAATDRPAEPAHESSERDVIDLLRRRATAERRRRRGTAILGAAAGLALLAGGVTAGTAITGPAGPVQRPAHAHGTPVHDHGTPAQDLLNTGERRSATDPTTRVAGTVALETKGWGTHVALDLSSVRGPLVCRLVAVTRSGSRHVVTEWAVPKAGYGLPGSPGHLAVHGGTASGRSDITRFEVQAEGGRTLLTIPV
jgi:hypothetical protein